MPPPSAVSPSPRLCAPAGVPAPLFLPLALCTFRYVFAVCLSPNFFSLIHSLAGALSGPSSPWPLHPASASLSLCLPVRLPLSKPPSLENALCFSVSLPFPSPPFWVFLFAFLLSLPLQDLRVGPPSRSLLLWCVALSRLFSPRAACPVSCGLGPAQPLWAEQRRGLPQGICSQKPQTVSPGALWEPQGSVPSSSHTLLRDWVSRSFSRGPPHLTHLSQILRGCSDPLSSVSSERPGGQHCTEKTPDVFLACILSNSVNLKH